MYYKFLVTCIYDIVVNPRRTCAARVTVEISYHSLKKEILQIDLSLLLADASTHPSQQYVQAVASSNDGSWLKLWDMALERGVTCIQSYTKVSLPPRPLRRYMSCS